MVVGDPRCGVVTRSVGDEMDGVHSCSPDLNSPSTERSVERGLGLNSSPRTRVPVFRQGNGGCGVGELSESFLRPSLRNRPLIPCLRGACLGRQAEPRAWGEGD